MSEGGDLGGFLLVNAKRLRAIVSHHDAFVEKARNS